MTFDALAALRVLLLHEVRFVVIGGFAAGVLGSPLITFDLDICYERSRSNHEALARALHELGATLRGAPAGLPFILDARTLATGDSFTFDTTCGPLDCLGTPAGTEGYGDLLRGAEETELAEDVRVRVASIDDLIRMKRAADRPKDRIAIENLSALKEERQKLGLD